MTPPVPGPPPKPAPPPRSGRVAVMKKYARLNPKTGWPLRCGPLDLPVKKRKIIFDTAEQAIAAGAELELCGARPQRAYPCPRSRSGHHHLTGDIDGEPHRAATSQAS